MSEALLDVTQVAERLGMSTTWVRQRIDSGEIPHIRLGGRIRLRPEQVDAYIESRMVTE